MIRLWKKLDEMYMTKSMPNQIYLKEKFYGFRMDESKQIEDSFDEYNKLLLDLEILGTKLEEEDKIVILLNSLPKWLKNFKEALKYERETISVDDIQNTLNSKLLDMKSYEKVSSG